MSGKAAVPGGDPRRPEEAQRPPRPAADEEIDGYLVLSMMVGLAGFMLKHILLAWVALFVCVIGIANLKSTSALQHVMTSVVFSIMGLVANYTYVGPRGLAAVFPPRPEAAAAGAA
ncbi:MAG: hypothetical protein J3K34DRAFT_437196 [Monoraphidium minutum]|nr:MAG: hypothetical protein J3K34DRAFT_437196 [Monoraphidium minutum]